jgi:hypothetical protein
MAVNDLITFRKGTSSAWTSVNPVLASGEPGYDLTNSILKIGDGVSNWVALSGIGSTSVGGSSSSSVGVRGIISVTGTLTSFAVSGGYPVGYLDLFQDGVKLVSSLDFSATDGSNVTLNNSVPSGTVLEYLTMASGVTSGGGSSYDSRWDLFLPPAPTGLTATGGNAQASLSWVAPTVLSQTPITDYTIQSSSNSGSSWTTLTRAVSTATNVTVTGLTNGTAVVFRVSATNGVGTGSYSTASSAVTPAVPNLSATLTSGGGLNSWRWNTANSYFDSEIFFGRWDDNTVSQVGWRTTWNPSSKPTSISSATFTLPYTWASNGKTAFSAVLRGAKIANAGQGIQGTSPTTASATGSVTTSNGTLTVDCTAVIAEIIGQSGWTPGNSIVLYLSGENASLDREIYATDSAGSLVINYA